jgi:mRNA-degrading endonuclease toxin of MazEF toxin-antitoxin module
MAAGPLQSGMRVRRGEVWWVGFDPDAGRRNPQHAASYRSVAVCDRVRAVDKRRLTRSEGRLSMADMRSVEEGLRHILEL